MKTQFLVLTLAALVLLTYLPQHAHTLSISPTPEAQALVVIRLLKSVEMYAPELAKRALEEFDTDKGGNVTTEEVTNTATKRASELATTVLEKLNISADVTINAQTINALAGEKVPGLAEFVVEKLDVNKDNVLSAADAKEFVKQLAELASKFNHTLTHEEIVEVVTNVTEKVLVELKKLDPNGYIANNTQEFINKVAQFLGALASHVEGVNSSRQINNKVSRLSVELQPNVTEALETFSISAQNITDAVTKFVAEQAPRVVGIFDYNHDGSVSVADFNDLAAKRASELAPFAIKLFDFNDDEVVTAGEISGEVTKKAAASRFFVQAYARAAKILPNIIRCTSKEVFGNLGGIFG